MQKFFLSLCLLLFSFLLIPKPVMAASEFSTDYTVTVDINTNNVTHVTQKITITNLQSGTYAREYALTVSTITPENLRAYNQNGNLKTETSQDNGVTSIKVLFDEKVIGKDKKLAFTLEYDTKDMVKQEGEVRTVIVPRIAVSEGLSGYNLTVQYPKTFGKAALMAPRPVSERETYNKFIASFNKDEFINRGLVMIFGEKQYFTITMPYTLVNPNLVNVDQEILLVPSSPYQYVEIENIEPKPKNIVSDDEGNWIAKYTVERGKELNILVTEKVMLSAVPQYKSQLTDTQKQLLLQRTPYWETDRGKIDDIIKQLLGIKNANDLQGSQTQANAQKIFQFVVATLRYNPQLQDPQGDARAGAYATLEKPTQASDIDFADLFVTLARAAHIPSRVVIGFVSQPGAVQPSQPSAGLPRTMHAWAEYYDPENGWVPVDPLWTATAGGIDYFSHWDLQHVALAFWGMQDDAPYPLGLREEADGKPVTVLAPATKFEPQQPKVTLKVETQSESLFGVPGRATVVIENSSKAALANAVIKVEGKGVTINGDLSKTMPAIPPLSTTEIPFTYQSDQWFRISRGTIVVTVNGQAYHIPLAPISFKGRMQNLVVVPMVGGVAIGILVYFLTKRRNSRLINPKSLLGKKLANKV